MKRTQSQSSCAYDAQTDNIYFLVKLHTPYVVFPKKRKNVHY